MRLRLERGGNRFRLVEVGETGFKVNILYSFGTETLRARPEPTQLEHLPDATFLGKLQQMLDYTRK
jgi:hypothetical protein